MASWRPPGEWEKLKKRVATLSRGEVGDLVRQRIEEFRRVPHQGMERVFSELAFCILTANYSAEGGIRIQETLGHRAFLEMPEEELARRLRELGHRFPEARARYIVMARPKARVIYEMVKRGGRTQAMRQWLAGNVKGIGYKEASHFLRNTGHLDVAILDYHVLDVLDKHGIVRRPRSLTPRRYMEIEEVVKKLAEELSMAPGELDLYLWYMETGKVLK